MKKYKVQINGEKQEIESSSHKAATRTALQNIKWPKDRLYEELHIDIWVSREG